MDRTITPVSAAGGSDHAKSRGIESTGFGPWPTGRVSGLPTVLAAVFADRGSRPSTRSLRLRSRARNASRLGGRSRFASQYAGRRAQLATYVPNPTPTTLSGDTRRHVESLQDWIIPPGTQERISRPGSGHEWSPWVHHPSGAYGPTLRPAAHYDPKRLLNAVPPDRAVSTAIAANMAKVGQNAR